MPTAYFSTGRPRVRRAGENCFPLPLIRKVKNCRISIQCAAGRSVGTSATRETRAVFQRARQLWCSQAETCLQCSVIYSHGRSLRVIYIYRQNSRRQFGICIHIRSHGCSSLAPPPSARFYLTSVRPSICRIRRAKNVRYVLRNMINNANTIPPPSLAHPPAHLPRDTDSSFSIMPLFKLVKQMSLQETIACALEYVSLATRSRCPVGRSRKTVRSETVRLFVRFIARF